MSAAAECAGKRAYLTWLHAAQAEARTRRRRRFATHPYRCRYCHQWHLGGQPTFQRPRRPEERSATMPEVDNVELSAEERLAWYEAEIRPTLAALAERCAARGLDFVAAVQVTPHELGTVWMHGNLLSRAFLYMMMAAKGGSEDMLIAEMIRAAGQAGHNSAYLARLGVPRVPVQPEAAQ